MAKRPTASLTKPLALALLLAATGLPAWAQDADVSLGTPPDLSQDFLDASGLTALMSDTSLSDINALALSGDVQGLKDLAGVGPSRADKIIKYVGENGAIGSVAELTNISGIGTKTVNKILNGNSKVEVTANVVVDLGGALQSLSDQGHDVSDVLAAAQAADQTFSGFQDGGVLGLFSDAGTSITGDTGLQVDAATTLFDQGVAPASVLTSVAGTDVASQAIASGDVVKLFEAVNQEQLVSATDAAATVLASAPADQGFDVKLFDTVSAAVLKDQLDPLADQIGSVSQQLDSAQAALDDFNNDPGNFKNNGELKGHGYIKDELAELTGAVTGLSTQLDDAKKTTEAHVDSLIAQTGASDSKELGLLVAQDSLVDTTGLFLDQGTKATSIHHQADVGLGTLVGAGATTADFVSTDDVTGLATLDVSGVGLLQAGVSTDDHLSALPLQQAVQDLAGFFAAPTPSDDLAGLDPKIQQLLASSDLVSIPSPDSVAPVGVDIPSPDSVAPIGVVSPSAQGGTPLSTDDFAKAVDAALDFGYQVDDFFDSASSAATSDDLSPASGSPSTADLFVPLAALTSVAQDDASSVSLSDVHTALVSTGGLDSSDAYQDLFFALQDNLSAPPASVDISAGNPQGPTPALDSQSPLAVDLGGVSQDAAALLLGAGASVSDFVLTDDGPGGSSKTASLLDPVSLLGAGSDPSEIMKAFGPVQGVQALTKFNTKQADDGLSELDFINLQGEAIDVALDAGFTVEDFFIDPFSSGDGPIKATLGPSFSVDPFPSSGFDDGGSAQQLSAADLDKQPLSSTIDKLTGVFGGIIDSSSFDTLTADTLTGVFGGIIDSSSFDTLTAPVAPTGPTGPIQVSKGDDDRLFPAVEMSALLSSSADPAAVLAALEDVGNFDSQQATSELLFGYQNLEQLASDADSKGGPPAFDIQVAAAEKVLDIAGVELADFFAAPSGPTSPDAQPKGKSIIDPTALYAAGADVGELFELTAKAFGKDAAGFIAGEALAGGNVALSDLTAALGTSDALGETLAQALSFDAQGGSGPAAVSLADLSKAGFSNDALAAGFVPDFQSLVDKGLLSDDQAKLLASGQADPALTAQLASVLQSPEAKDLISKQFSSYMAPLGLGDDEVKDLFQQQADQATGGNSKVDQLDDQLAALHAGIEKASQAGDDALVAKLKKEVEAVEQAAQADELKGKLAELEKAMAEASSLGDGAKLAALEQKATEIKQELEDLTQPSGVVVVDGDASDPDDSLAVSVDSLGQVAVDDFAKALFEASKKAKEQGVPFDEKLFAVDYEKSHGPLTTAMQNILDIGHDVSGPVTVVIDKPLSSGGGGSSTGPSALSGPYFESAGGTYGIQMCLANEAGPALDYSLAAQPLLMNTRGGKIFLLQRRNKEALYKPVKPGHGFLGRSTFGHGKKAMQAPVGFIRIKR